jgi:hypothetical protein
MRSKILVLTVASLALVALFAGASGAKKRNPKFEAFLTGYEEVPPTSTPANGELRLTLKKQEPVLSYRLTYRNITNAVAAHIHFGQTGVNGGVAAFLCGGGDKPACPPTGGTVTGVIDAGDVVGPVNQGIDVGELTELIRAVRFGMTYVNVHTSDGDDSMADPLGPGDFPTGEIRGQIFRLAVPDRGE